VNYVYNAAITTNETGTPIMRSMPMAFPGEQEVAGIEDQYMFGSDMLVAPVLTSEDFRTVTFPSGIWTSLWDGKTVTGPIELKVNTPLDMIPVYLKQGAVVPVELSKDLQFGRSMTNGRVGALVTTPPKEKEDVVLVNQDGGAARVIAQTTAQGSSWELIDLPEVSYVLIYGTTSSTSVKVDGVEMQKVTAAGFDGMPVGWQVDVAGNRLVIHMPSIQTKMPRRIIEVN
jgi:alpha-glucosidase (family GH31 glycosyl hydrolase)